MKKNTLDAAHQHLRKHPRMKEAIKKLTLKPFSRAKDPFASLVQSIIYQQVSGKAAASILKKFLALFPRVKFPTPEMVLKKSDAQLRGAGLSGQKVKYVKDLSARFLDGTIEPKKFPKMSDDEIRAHLIVVKGIGRWTADMFLMFTLFRPDVLPTGDLAIQKGFQKLFGMKKLPDVKKMEKLAKDWAPHRTVASLYLWQAVDGENSDW